MKRACLALLFGFAACASHSPTAPRRACAEISSPDAARVLSARCASCHSASGSAGEEHDFSDPALVRRQAPQIAARLRAFSMPPRGTPQPSDEQRELLARWAECGAH